MSVDDAGNRRGMGEWRIAEMPSGDTLAVGDLMRGNYPNYSYTKEDLVSVYFTQASYVLREVATGREIFLEKKLCWPYVYLNTEEAIDPGIYEVTVVSSGGKYSGILSWKFRVTETE